MKKILVISLSCIIVLSLLCVGISAQSSVTDLTDTSWSIPDILHNDFSSNEQFSLLFTSNGQNFQGFLVQVYANETRLLYFLVGNTWSLVYSSIDDWTNPEYRYIHITGGNDVTSSNALAFFNNYCTYISPDNYDVGEGVTSFIGFSGQVLDFITSSQGLLALLGLSVGLCLIVPFSIRKIKDFVKGY